MLHIFLRISFFLSCVSSILFNFEEIFLKKDKRKLEVEQSFFLQLVIVSYHFLPLPGHHCWVLLPLSVAISHLVPKQWCSLPLFFFYFGERARERMGERPISSLFKGQISAVSIAWPTSPFHLLSSTKPLWSSSTLHFLIYEIWIFTDNLNFLWHSNIHHNIADFFITPLFTM